MVVSYYFSCFQGSLLVNIARGGILDYDAVYQHLKTGHLGGLGIDVAWFEPFNPDDPILKLPNVLITPHVGGVTKYSYRTMAKVLFLLANFLKILISTRIMMSFSYCLFS